VSTRTQLIDDGMMGAYQVTENVDGVTWVWFSYFRLPAVSQKLKAERVYSMCPTDLMSGTVIMPSNWVMT
jgi:hypothetical protein